MRKGTKEIKCNRPADVTEFISYLGDGVAWFSLLLLFMGVRGFSATDTVMQGPTSENSS